jgi:histidinol-phosphate aminotransferase
MTDHTRRQFLGTVGASALAISARPVFSLHRPFGEQAPSDDIVHINFNENPYGPSPAAIKSIQNAAVAMYSRYFPDDSYEELSKALAAHHRVKRENIQVTVGSTEVLKICDDVFLGPKPRLVVAEPAYEAVIQYAVNSKATASRVKLTPDHRHDLARMADAITPDTGLVYVCNPNNPTGTIVRKDELARFMERVPLSVTVVVDEAYAEFVSDPEYESALRYVRDGRNVIVAKTFSKVHGLAGMRIGYAIGPAALIKKIKPSTVDYAMTGGAARAAVASLADSQHLDRVVKLNAVQRDLFVDEMKRARFECAQSHANFVMVNLRRPVEPVIAALAKKRVLVGRLFPAMPTFLRVTMGTEAEMQRFYAAFREVMRG